jgi:hypothetical protein
MQFPRCDIQPAGEGFYCQCIGCKAISVIGGCVLIPESEGVYRSDGQTPHGGVLAHLYFTDSSGNLTPKESASYVEIREMDKDGNVLHIDYGIVDDMGFTLKSKSSK